MKHADLIPLLAERADISNFAAQRVLKALPILILEGIARGDTVKIHGLGWFIPDTWRSNKVTHFRTGATIVPPIVPTFRLKTDRLGRGQLRKKKR